MNEYEQSVSYWFRFSEFLVYKNYNFKEVMVYLCLMGLQDVVKDFCSWCDSIKDKFVEIVGPLVPSNPDVTGKKFLSVIIDLFPDDYRYMLEYDSFQVNTWLNSRWQIMLQPQKRTKDGRDIRMPLVGIEQIPELSLLTMNPLFDESKIMGLSWII